MSFAVHDKKTRRGMVMGKPFGRTSVFGVAGRFGGFTVIEVIVIVAVIGIVVAIAMPAHMRSQEIGHARECQENLARISGAVEALALRDSLGHGARITMDDLVQTSGTGFLREMPQCPAGGKYSVSVVGAVPVCSIGENDGAAYAPHLYTTAVPRVGR